MEEKYWILLNKHAANNLSPAEQEELQHWVDDDPERSNLLNDFREIQHAVSASEDGPAVDVDAAWMQMKQHIAEEENPEPVVQEISMKQFILRAVIFIVIVSVALIGYHSINNEASVTVTTSAKEQKDVILPDGSQVHLYENSAIAYFPSFKNESERKIVLKGAAFFEVSKDPGHPFIIETGITETTALGTSFNVYQEPNEAVRVEVVTGKVSFREKGNAVNELTLQPGDAGTIEAHKEAVLSKTKDTNFLFFRNHELRFEDVPLTEVLNTLEKAYNVSFTIKGNDLRKQRISTTFSKQNIAEVVQTLRVLLKVNIHVSGINYLIEPIEKF